MKNLKTFLILAMVIVAAGVAYGQTATQKNKSDNANNSENILRDAMDKFNKGWKTGDWEPFLSTLSKEDFIFQFPAGPFKGRHTENGYQKIREWALDHGKLGNRITAQETDLILVKDDLLLFTDTASGNLYNNPYHSKHAILLKTDGQKIVEYREYVGDLTDWK